MDLCEDLEKGEKLCQFLEQLCLSSFGMILKFIYIQQFF